MELSNTSAAAPARRRRFPAGLAGALAVILAVEAAVDRHDEDRFTTVGAAAWAHASDSARRLVAEAGPDVGVLSFGDSLVKYGVIPAVLQKRLDRPSWNLAMPWGQAFGHDVLLRRILRDGGRPDALIVDGELLGDDPTERTRVWPELITLSESVELAWASADSGLFGELALSRLIPSVRVRADLRAQGRALLTRRMTPDPLAVPVHRLNWQRNFGAQPLPVPALPPRFDPTAGDWSADREGWACHPVNVTYIDRFLARAATHDIPVFWLLPPTHPDVHDARRRSGRNAAIEAFVRDLAARHPNLTVLDARGAGYPPAAMADATHLNRDGAAVFSAAVAEAIADRLGRGPRPSSRWVDLPAWDPILPARLRETIAMEDVRETAEGLATR